MLGKPLVGEVARAFSPISPMKSMGEQKGAGALAAFDGKGLFSTPPAPSRSSGTITDEELRSRYGDAAELLIDALDRRPETQKPEGKAVRDREAVERFLDVELDRIEMQRKG